MGILQSGSRLDLSIVAPCYNEELVITELLRRINYVVCGLDDELSYEIVLVNDGSRDQTWPMLQAAAEADPHIVAVNLSRNHGHQLALTAGLNVCRGNKIFIIDADLQDPPELLPEMLEVMDREKADVVYGQRRQRVGETRFKLLTAAVFYRLIERLTDVPIPRDTGDFRLISRRALDVLIGMPERHRFIRGMVSWIGFRQVPFLYDRDQRFAGETKYPLKKMIRFALDAITAFSTRPLVISNLLGILVGLFGIAMVGYSLIVFFRGETERGWTSLVAVVCILGAVQLFVLGIFGEYLGRMYEQIKGRPLFVIQDICNHDGSLENDPTNPHINSHEGSVPLEADVLTD